MPELCRFLGIVIYMYYRDHAPPHFHAEYAEFEINCRNRVGRHKREIPAPRAEFGYGVVLFT